MKGIILAGGAGTRLYPITKVMTKQLQPIYDKPMIYYPLSLLMIIGVKEILIISTPEDLPLFEKILGNGNNLGIKIEYTAQQQPDGIAQAYILGEKFIDGDHSIMILGDNLFHGNFDCFRKAIEKQIAGKDQFKARVFAYPVNDPERFGVVEFDPKTREVLSLEEKPTKPKSKYAVPGIYIFDGSVSSKAKEQKQSERGELEITDLNRAYLEKGLLTIELISRGMAWLDTGTPEALLEASNFVAILEQRQGLKISCLEEIAYRMNYINLEEFKLIVNILPKGPYREYLEEIYLDATRDLPRLGTRKAS